MGLAGNGCDQGHPSKYMNSRDLEFANDTDSAHEERRNSQSELFKLLGTREKLDDTPNPAAVEETNDNVIASASDRRTFLYYIRSISPWTFTIFMVGMVGSAFLDRFPGKSSEGKFGFFGYCTGRQRLTRSSLQVYWIQLWSEANERNPQLTNNGYYAGIYGLLNGLNFCLLFWTVWQVDW